MRLITALLLSCLFITTTQAQDVAKNYQIAVNGQVIAYFTNATVPISVLTQQKKTDGQADFSQISLSNGYTDSPDMFNHWQPGQNMQLMILSNGSVTTTYDVKNASISGISLSNNPELVNGSQHYPINNIAFSIASMKSD